MNSFKLILAVCSVLVASCSGNYMQSGRPSWDNQATASPAVHTGMEGSVGGHMWAYANNDVTTAAPQSGSYEQSAPAHAQQTFAAAPSAPTHTNIPSSAFPAVTQQICTCIVVPESTTAAMVEQSQQSAQQAVASAQEFAAPAQQQQSAYSAQQMASPAQAQQQQTGSYSAPSRPAGGDRGARPAYAAAPSTGY